MSFDSQKIPRERYNIIRDINMEMNIHSRIEYIETRLTHPKYIDDPVKYFENCWTSWYHFLGINCETFPETKTDWIRACKNQVFTSWSDYTERHDKSFPDNPADLYSDFTNWDKEMNVEEVLVW